MAMVAMQLPTHFMLARKEHKGVTKQPPTSLPQFPTMAEVGRVCVGAGSGYETEIKRPIKVGKGCTPFPT